MGDCEKKLCLKDVVPRGLYLAVATWSNSISMAAISVHWETYKTRSSYKISKIWLISTQYHLIEQLRCWRNVCPWSRRQWCSWNIIRLRGNRRKTINSHSQCSPNKNLIFKTRQIDSWRRYSVIVQWPVSFPSMERRIKMMKCQGNRPQRDPPCSLVRNLKFHSRQKGSKMLRLPRNQTISLKQTMILWKRMNLSRW